MAGSEVELDLPQAGPFSSSSPTGSRATQSGRPRSQRAPRTAIARATNRDGWLLVAPALILMLAMTAFPAIYLLQASMFDFTLLGDSRVFVGLGNFVQVFEDGALRTAFLLTFAFVAGVVILELVVGLVLALGLARQSIFNNVSSTLLLLPMAVTPAVSALVFRQLLNPNFGWIDHYLRQLGLISTPIEWLSDTTTAWLSLIALDMWQWTPFVALILMAGRQALSREPFDAAAVDGAGPWQTFRYVTLPMLRPFIGVAVVLRLIQAFKTFDSFKVLTDGGPGDSTEIVNLAIHRIALQSFRIGDAAALGIVFLGVLSILAPLALRLTKGIEAGQGRAP